MGSTIRYNAASTLYEVSVLFVRGFFFFFLFILVLIIIINVLPITPHYFQVCTSARTHIGSVIYELRLDQRIIKPVPAKWDQQPMLMPLLIRNYEYMAYQTFVLPILPYFHIYPMLIQLLL